MSGPPVVIGRGGGCVGVRCWTQYVVLLAVVSDVKNTCRACFCTCMHAHNVTTCCVCLSVFKLLFCCIFWCCLRGPTVFFLLLNDIQGHGPTGRAIWNRIFCAYSSCEFGKGHGRVCPRVLLTYAQCKSNWLVWCYRAANLKGCGWLSALFALIRLAGDMATVLLFRPRSFCSCSVNRCVCVCKAKTGRTPVTLSLTQPQT